MEPRLTLDHGRIGTALGIMIAGFLIVSLLSDIAFHAFDHEYQRGLRVLVALDFEQNLPTWFQVLQLLAAASLLAAIGLAPACGNRRESLQWCGLALVFVFAGFDEAFQVHEQLGPWAGKMGGRVGPFFYAWVVPGLIIALAVGASFIGFLRRLEPETRRRFLLAGGCFLAGALGMEMLDGWYAALRGRDFVYALLITLEEGLEMAGIRLFILALLQELGRRKIAVAFQ